jgi:hypothetical protein
MLLLKGKFVFKDTEETIRLQQRKECEEERMLKNPQ